MSAKLNKDSRLIGVEIWDFMSVANGRVDYDDSNIISLCGYNNVGKSAMTRSAEIMLYNAYSSEQAKFIKDGAEFWKIRWEFSDGVVIDRYKYMDGKSVWAMSKNGTKVFTNKIGTSVASMTDIPEIVADYLGVVKDEHTGEQLNVRRNTDRLFLINTTGGDNYKILNSILKSDVLADASRGLNEDKNKLQAKMQGVRTSCDTLKEESENLDVAPKVLVDDLKSSIKEVEYIKDKQATVEGVKAAFDDYSSIVLYNELEVVNVDRLSTLNRLKELGVGVNVIIPPLVSEVSIDRLKNIKDIKVLKHQKDEVVPNELNGIDMSRLKLIDSVKLKYEDTKIVIPPVVDSVDVLALSSLNRIKEIISEYTDIADSLKGVENRLVSVTTQLKDFEKRGYKICENCGSAVI